MALEKHQFMTVEEYFQLEESDPDTRYEYEDGYAYAMAGGTVNHGTISGNLYRILWGLLRGKNCQAYTDSVKVPVTETRYYYPDVTVACGPRDPGEALVIRSPRVVIEVLSPSTADTDRTRKLKYYRAHPTIEEYLLVDSRRVRAEIYRRKGDIWVYDDFEDGDTITLESLDVQFPLIDAYIDVEFEELPEDDEFDD